MPTDNSPMTDELELQMSVRASDQMIGWAATPEQAAQYMADGFEQTPIPEPRDPNHLMLIRADGAIAWCENDAEEERARSRGFCLPNELPEPKRALDLGDITGE